MTTDLVASFEKKFRGGATISAELQVPTGEFSLTVLFGPSGCGKTTVLRCLGGLERPERGLIQFGEDVWFDSSRHIHRTPQERDIGFLFQDYALFPHLSVEQNVGYGLSTLSSSERARRVETLLRAFGLCGLEDRYPDQISGGQQQRVALARALARRPRLLLLDEPLSALDAPLREELRLLLREQLAAFNIPTILVTHDRLEAISLADQLVVMHDGKVRQIGAPAEILARPANVAVARSMGIENVIPLRAIKIVRTQKVNSDRGTVSSDASVDGGDYACFAADDVILQRDARASLERQYAWQARVIGFASEGAVVRVKLDCGFPLVALLARREFEGLNIQIDDSLTALLNRSAVRILEGSSDG